MSEEAAPDTHVPKDFVFMHRQLHRDGKVSAIIGVITAPGVLEIQSYTHDAKCKWLVGSRYTGAMFNSKGARGLNLAKWAELYESPDRMMWQAKDQEVTVQLRELKEQKNAKREDEIANQMLELRRLHARYMDMNDFAGCAALRSAVVRALQRRPRKGE